jgi:hypothetical protein
VPAVWAGISLIQAPVSVIRGSVCLLTVRGRPEKEHVVIEGMCRPHGEP